VSTRSIMGCAASAPEPRAPAEEAKTTKPDPKDAGKLTYFAGLRSRGEPTQIIAAYGGIKMDVELIGFEEWGNRKGKIAQFLPYITNPDGSIMVETCVICKHLATVGGKFVLDEKQDELIKIANDPPIQAADPVYNLPDQGASFGVPPLAEWKAAAAEVLKDYAAKLGGGPFFAGDKPGYAEAFVWHNLDNCFAIDKPGFTEAIGEEAMAKLTAFYDKFAVLDGVKDYLAKRPETGSWGMPGSFAQPAAESAAPACKKVVILCTSAEDFQGHKSGAWSEEVTGPFYTFSGKGCEVIIASIKGGKVPIDAFSLSEGFKTENDTTFETTGDVKKLESTVAVSTLAPEAFDCIFLAGGHGTVVDFPDGAADIVSKAAAAGKVVGAVCHGPHGLLKATVDGKPLVAGKKVCGFSNEEEAAVIGMRKFEEKITSLEDELKAKGGEYVTGAMFAPNAVRDGSLITGQNPGSSVKAAELCCEALGL